MLLAWLILIPVLGAGSAFLDPDRRRRSVWLITSALAHVGLLVASWSVPHRLEFQGWLSFDSLGGIVLTLISVIFLTISFYSVGYLHHESPRGGRVFESCLLLFLASASAVCLSVHLGILWVAMEATTLATAPLIYDPTDRHSLEAVWKYLLICSVGIALALLGTFLLALTQLGAGDTGGILNLSALIAAGTRLNPEWFRAAFIFLFIGYGTKVGLVPMHTWLPDAHGEAPSPISALLSGALLNCALLAILRVHQVAAAAGQLGAVGPVMISFGLASVLVAAALLLRQPNYKRMLAYSSIEHMGLLAVGFGVGKVAAFGALLHMIGSSLAKALLFLVAGNILIHYRTKRVRDVTGVLRSLPVSGCLLVAGFLALTGSPPFAPFLSELTLLSGTVKAGRPLIAVILVVLQLVAFVGMGTSVLRMAQGGGSSPPVPVKPENSWLVFPPAALLALLVVLGLWIPGDLHRILAEAATGVGGVAP